MANEDMISLSEAKTYVEKHLKIANFEEKVKSNRLSALNELIRATAAYYPFQDIDLMALPAEQRRVPTYSDIKKSFFSGKGGLCVTGNTFTQHVISHFGYESYLVAGTAKGFERTYVDGHAVIIVKNLVNNGDLYLVDVCCGYPTFEAVSLTGEPKIYKNSFLEYVVVKMDDGKYHRYHLKGDDRKIFDSDGRTVKIGEDRKIFYVFDLEPRSQEFFRKSMHETFTSFETSVFLREFLVALYPPGKAFTLHENLLRIYDEETGKLSSMKLETFEDFSNAIHNVMKIPVVDDKELKTAFDVYDKLKSKENGKNGHVLN